MPEQTPEGLPLVSEATLESFLEEEIKNEAGEISEDTTYVRLERLKKTNPEVATYILTGVGLLTMSGAPAELVEWALHLPLGVYDILARQAESNKLAEGLCEHPPTSL